MIRFILNKQLHHIKVEKIFLIHGKILDVRFFYLTRDRFLGSKCARLIATLFNIYRFELQEPHNHEIEDELDVDFEESEDDAETDDEEDDDFSDLRKNYINYLIEIDNENK